MLTQNFQLNEMFNFCFNRCGFLSFKIEYEIEIKRMFRLIVNDIGYQYDKI